MKRCTFLVLMTGVALLTSHTWGQVPNFSLDDFPGNPITTQPGGPIPGWGAEDPYGLGLSPMGPLTPSPTLPVPPAMDGDILMPSPAGGGFPPVVNTGLSPMYGGPVSYLDAVGRNSDISPNKANRIHLSFSVDRLTRGLPGTDVNRQAMLSQQPGDVFRTESAFPHPINFVGTPPASFGYNGPLPIPGIVPGQNHLLFDESELGLTPFGVPGALVGPSNPGGPLGMASHDNVDALNFQPFDRSGDLITDTWQYYSINPDQALITGFAPADIYDTPPGALPQLPPAMAPFALANQLGLMEFEDDVDALIVWDQGQWGGPDWGGPGAEPMMDYALFSLSPGSTSLGQYGLNPGDVFFTNFTGAFWTFASAQQVGLEEYFALELFDNIDALEVLVPGDATLDGRVDVSDLGVLAGHWGGPGRWQTGDFSGDGLVNVSDLGILAGAWSTSSKSVPEPTSLILLAAGGLALLRRQP